MGQGRPLPDPESSPPLRDSVFRVFIWPLSCYGPISGIEIFPSHPISLPFAFLIDDNESFEAG